MADQGRHDFNNFLANMRANPQAPVPPTQAPHPPAAPPPPPPPPQGYAPPVPPAAHIHPPAMPPPPPPGGYAPQAVPPGGTPAPQHPQHAGPPGYPQQPQPGPQPPGYPPQQAPGYPSQQPPGYAPQQAPGYPPQQAPGYPPQQAPGYPPQHAPAYPAPPGYGQQPPTGYGAPPPGYPAPQQPPPGYAPPAAVPPAAPPPPAAYATPASQHAPAPPPAPPAPPAAPAPVPPPAGQVAVAASGVPTAKKAVALVMRRPGPEALDVAVRPDLSLRRLLDRIVASGASDLHLSAGAPPCFRLKGDIESSGMSPLSPAEIEAMLFPVLGDDQRETFQETGDLDFALELPGVARFRANFSRQYRGMAAVLRIIPKDIPRLEDLRLPPAVQKIARLRRGLVIVTGPTGSGKTTTLAAIINEINHTRQAHIITVEDPLEFVHDNRMCQITHREVGAHATSFADALRAAIREDPDIVLVGEMRDLDTVSQAIHAAEMGLLVLGTLHTNNASKAVDRIIDIFPANEQEQIRVSLSEAVRAVVAQQLLKRADGSGRVAAHEILISTPALCNMIREGKTHQIPSMIQTGREQGMQLMDQSLIEMVQKGVITLQSAKEKMNDPRNFQRAGLNVE